MGSSGQGEHRCRVQRVAEANKVLYQVLGARKGKGLEGRQRTAMDGNIPS